MTKLSLGLSKDFMQKEEFTCGWVKHGKLREKTVLQNDGVTY